MNEENHDETIGSQDSVAEHMKDEIPVEDRIIESLEKIRPYLNSEGGDVEFVEFNKDSGVVSVRLQGACGHCAISSVTLKMGIEQAVMEDVSEVTEVVQIE